MQAQALRRRIEMRINRVPKKMWTAKMGELLLQQIAAASTFNVPTINTKVFVEDVKRLSGRQGENPSDGVVVVSKKRVTKVVASTHSRFDKAPTNLIAPSTHPLSSNSPAKINIVRPPLSPIKRVFSPPPSQKDRSGKISPLEPSQLPVTDNSQTESTTIKSSTKTSGKISRSNAAKSRNLKPMPLISPPISVEGQHPLKSVRSTGSLKENKFDGVKNDIVGNGKTNKTTALNSVGSVGGRRVLRARK